MGLINKAKNYIPIDILFSQKIIKSNKYQLREEVTIAKIKIPQGFVTDGATIPRTLAVFGLIFVFIFLVFDRWILAGVAGLINLVPFLFPADAKYFRAALVHDFLLFKFPENRRIADYKFKEILQQQQIARWRIIIMFSAVRIYSILKTRQL